MNQKLLIIDDDQKLNDRLARYLPKFGFDVVSATHPHDGLKMISTEQPDLIILDVMLPDMEGFEVCKQIRESSSTPVIMLTARGEVMDRIVGLELGADDYIPKPFEPRELVARIKTVLRRGARTRDIGNPAIRTANRRFQQTRGAAWRRAHRTDVRRIRNSGAFHQKSQAKCCRGIKYWIKCVASSGTRSIARWTC